MFNHSLHEKLDGIHVFYMIIEGRCKKDQQKEK